MRRYKPRRPRPTTDIRSPNERLEALVRETNPDRKDRMLGRILDDLDARPDAGPWISAARLLSDRLIISEAAFYYLAEKFGESVIAKASVDDPELVRLSEEIDAIERAAGLRD